MKKILITGSNGQLGNSIKKLEDKYKSSQFVYTDVAQLDITKQKEVLDFVAQGKFTHIVNCAAYTAVDKAEEEFELAKKINAIGPANLALAAKEQKALFVHVSTDYVFDGKAHRPYVESDLAQPPSAYGKSKLLGEEMVLEAAKGALIIRTSWLYSEFGNNFLKTMIKYGKEREELRVVFDQIGTPTYAGDLAEAILQVIHSDNTKRENQIYHYSNEGVVSWYDFAQEIMIATNIPCKISPILSAEYPLPAPRPFYSVLDKAKLKKDFSLEIPYWKEAMMRCLEALEK
ncbi:MAG: dTDP-4-dehydrorhamnose reductase [Bacteroidetes bacterium 4572_77]|nr:MAG: dTDP-4-dehydrorhamnose reductase [Bacteroidetes bacterium 4572_77]